MLSPLDSSAECSVLYGKLTAPKCTKTVLSAQCTKALLTALGTMAVLNAQLWTATVHCDSSDCRVPKSLSAFGCKAGRHKTLCVVCKLLIHLASTTLSHALLDEHAGEIDHLARTRQLLWSSQSMNIPFSFHSYFLLLIFFVLRSELHISYVIIIHFFQFF